MPRQPRAIAMGKRVLLRKPEPCDAREFIALRRASRSFLEHWEPRPPAGRDAFGRWGFTRLLATNRDGRDLKMLICLRSSGAIIGGMNLNGIVRGAMQGSSIGYWIGRAFARQGYATEAMYLALRHAFESMDLHRIEANIMPNNRASIALARVCGFRCEGVAKRLLQIDGRWRDHQRWAITAEEWQGRGRAD